MKRGFTLFFAMLVASLALAVGLAIYDLTIRELDLSGTTTQSQYAIYAADSGAECALYWDNKYNGNSTAFATSTASITPTSGITCDGADVALAGTPPAPFTAPQTTGNGWSAWAITAQTSSSAVTTFWLYLGVPGGNLATSSCAMVTVSKSGNPAATSITSSGYNTCLSGALQIERVLQVNY